MIERRINTKISCFTIDSSEVAKNKLQPYFKRVYWNRLFDLLTISIMSSTSCKPVWKSLNGLYDRTRDTHSAPVGNGFEIDSFHSKIWNICKVKPVNVVSFWEKNVYSTHLYIIFKWFCLLSMKLAVVKRYTERNPLSCVFEA